MYNFVFIIIHFSAIFARGRWSNMDVSSHSSSLRLLLDQMPAFCLASRAQNTQRQYRYAFNAFCKWCLSNDISKSLPASDTTVSAYLIYLTNIGKSSSTINDAFYAINWAHKLAGVTNPIRVIQI